MADTTPPAPATPYYQDDAVTLYHGDCREIAEWWVDADVLLTDPPYGISWRSHGGGRGRTKTVKHGGISNDADTALRDWALTVWMRRPAMIFGSLKVAPPTGIRQVLVWRKPPDAGLIGSTTGYRTDIEGIYLCGEWPVVPAHSSSVVASSVSNIGNPNGVIAQSGGHPHAKPVDLLGRLILNAPTGMIADPFAGSGSTLVAAKHAGRRAIGVELDERYCEMAARRLSQDVLDLGEVCA